MPPEIPIIFESPNLIAVNKPENLSSIPERDAKQEDLQTLLSKQIGARLFVVHRLDKGSTGVIVYAKNPDAHRFLNDQFAARKTKKRYMALVQGVVKNDDGLIETPLKQFGSGRMGVAAEGGLASTTRFRTVERFPCYTLLDAHPLTGRRHQIRVHLYSIGHPIVGDPLYGELRLQKPFGRTMLHARELEIEIEPGNPLFLEAKLPPSFTVIVDQVRSLQKPLTI
jgi:tRNA pseudouridine32 synthase/23S rRNA pseudouridine746 synthase